MSAAKAAAGLDRVAPAADGHLAPAKINLALHVTGRRPDGYHTLSSLVAFAGIGDRLSVSAAAADGIEVTGPFAAALASSLREGAGNILLESLRTVRAVAGRHGCAIGPLRLRLDKRLPVASGIGGGSADAAALLRLVIRACPRLEVPLLEAAVGLGADVPMCVGGRTARVAGIGEIVRPVPSFPAVPAVLVNPGVPVATPLVFSRLASRQNPPMPQIPPLAGVDGVVAYLAATRNDLEEPATGLAPQIAEARRALVDAGALLARMSGSGATVFGLFADRGQAASAACTVAARHPGWWAEPTILGSAEEAGG